MKITNLITFTKSITTNLLKREILFLPLGTAGLVFDISQNKYLLPLRYTYRASAKGIVNYRMQVSGSDLRYQVYTTGSLGGRLIPKDLCFSLSLPSVGWHDCVRVNLVEASAWINDQPIDVVSHCQQRTRKLIAKLELSTGQKCLNRVCMHYLPFDNKLIGSDYYFGDDYVDYRQQTDVRYALNLVQTYCSEGRLLDIGCAFGIYTKAFLEAGFDAYGLDISEFAISEASKNVSPDRVKQCNLDLFRIPFASTFDVFWMWDVLEHSADPQAMLEKITNRASSGTWLFLHTSNSESLTQRIFGSDWEGYSDYSHHGIDKISTGNLATWLSELHWEIIKWKCDGVWVEGVDPIILRLREAFQKIPELKLLLSEHELGDAITVVARKRLIAIGE